VFSIMRGEKKKEAKTNNQNARGGRMSHLVEVGKEGKTLQKKRMPKEKKELPYEKTFPKGERTIDNHAKRESLLQSPTRKSSLNYCNQKEGGEMGWETVEKGSLSYYKGKKKLDPYMGRGKKKKGDLF